MSFQFYKKPDSLLLDIIVINSILHTNIKIMVHVATHYIKIWSGMTDGRTDRHTQGPSIAHSTKLFFSKQKLRD